MNVLVMLDAYGMRGDQLWYVAHPVHPTAEDVAAYRAGENEIIAYARSKLGPSPGFVIEHRKTDREVLEQIIRDNIASAKLWLAWLRHRFPTISFIMPWVVALDGGGDDDLDPAARARGLRDCCRTVRVCHGIVHVGGRISGGMKDEASYARSVIDLTFLGRTPPARIEAAP